MHADWVLEIQEQCEKADVAFFSKQGGGTSNIRTGKVVEGRPWAEMPELPELYRTKNQVDIQDGPFTT